MKNRFWQVSWLAFGLAALPAQAHFKLLAPASWLVENQLGDPQKAGSKCSPGEIRDLPSRNR